MISPTIRRAKTLSGGLPLVNTRKKKSAGRTSMIRSRSVPYGISPITSARSKMS